MFWQRQRTRIRQLCLRLPQRYNALRPTLREPDDRIATIGLTDRDDGGAARTQHLYQVSDDLLRPHRLNYEHALV